MWGVGAMELESIGVWCIHDHSTVGLSDAVCVCVQAVVHQTVIFLPTTFILNSARALLHIRDVGVVCIGNFLVACRHHGILYYIYSYCQNDTVSVGLV